MSARRQREFRGGKQLYIWRSGEESRERGERNGTSAEYGMTTLFSSLLPSFIFLFSFLEANQFFSSSRPGCRSESCYAFQKVALTALPSVRPLHRSRLASHRLTRPKAKVILSPPKSLGYKVRLSKGMSESPGELTIELTLWHGSMTRVGTDGMNVEHR